ncbi:MAG: hypothetical protein WCP39_06420, partial [Chlamydiota bacterium]
SCNNKRLPVKQKEFSVELALDNLSIISELELTPNVTLGIVDDKKIISTSEDFPSSVDWLTIERMDEVISLMKEAYVSIFHYLRDMEKDPLTNWSHANVRKGLQSTLVLVGESTKRFDQYLSLFKEKNFELLENTSEYKTLLSFYLEKIATHFEGKLEGKEAWDLDRQEEKSTATQEDFEDFSLVQMDKEYELFYMRNEEERPFFSPALLKNLKLYCDFDEIADKCFLEDPLLRIQYMYDRDAQAASEQILHLVSPYLRDFFAKKIPMDEHEFAALLSKASMALMLASNSKNLIQNTSGKNSLRYFADFLLFLRELLSCNEYSQFITYGKEEELLDLAHRFCYAFFLRKVGNRQEMIGFIHRLMHLGEEKRKDPSSFWQKLLMEDSFIRKALEKFPSGPLFKDLDVIRSGEESIGFCPIRQGNFPCPLYSIGEKNQVEVVKIPSPTTQDKIAKAYVIEEFRGFIHFYTKHNKKHLLINLQDRTSWKEFARVHALEELSKQADYEKGFQVVTLSKNTAFYHQNEEYLTVSSTKEFLDQIKEQFSRPEECGFYIPKGISLGNFVEDFVEDLFDLFFPDSVEITHQNRLDFLEIFYGFLLLKCIEIYKPDSMSFTCKDGVDTGAVESGFFYAFIKLLTGSSFKREEEDFLRWLLYAPALLVRERAVDAERFYRALSALSFVEERLQKEAKKKEKLLAKWFDKETFRLIQLS